MSVLKGDFIGFTFNGVHSSELGIIRTSEGSRFNESLLPTIQDKTVQVPGGDGTYFFGSFYTQRQFNISIAFDSLTEKQFIELRKHFSVREPKQLIFDERPYKYYMAKITGTPQLKIICFDEETESGIQRIYKGEGSLSFICHYPFARSRFKFLDDYNSVNIKEWNNWPVNYEDGDLYNRGDEVQNPLGNLNEWIESSRIRPKVYTKPGTTSSITYDFPGENIYVYNAGDLETDIKIYYSFLENENLPAINVKIENDSSRFLSLNTMIKQGSDKMICINSKTQLIEGCDENYKPTGTLYNKYINTGDFFRLPIGDSIIESEGMAIDKVEYEYIYF